MLFNSFQFLWLFPLFFIVYYLGCHIFRKNIAYNRITNAILLLLSYLVYIQWDAVWGLILLAISLITYIGGLFFSRQNLKHRKLYIWLFSIAALSPLCIFKYYDFIHFQVGEILSAFNIGTEMNGLNLAIPLGLSFFSLQAVGYMYDVYYGRYRAEHNLLDYLLFVSFFPQIMAGPISQAQSLLPQIKSRRTFDYALAVSGCRMILWGFFMKVVMADQIGLCADAIINNYAYQSGATCAAGAILYSLQIYGDFAGYSLIAVGVGKLMGFNLINNFNRPYFAASITEFWHRWHISLTQWLTRNVYIPLKGSRCSRLRNYSNIMTTFLVSGIWHGANWTFIIWGALHGALQIIEKAFKIQKPSSGILRPFRIVLTFLLVTLAWIFFRADTPHDAFSIIGKIFNNPGELDIPGTNSQKLIMIAAISVVAITEWFSEYHQKVTLIGNRNIIIRWTTYLLLTVAILTCGAFDAGSFIYINF